LSAFVLEEASSCDAIAGHAQADADDLSRALLISEGTIFSDRRARELDFLYDSYIRSGDLDRAYSTLTKTAGLYWQGGVTGRRADELLTDMSLIAHTAGLHMLAQQAQEAAFHFKVDLQPIVLAVQYGLAGERAIDAGNDSTGLAYLRQANMIYSGLPDSAQKQLYEAYASAFTAERALTAHDYERALHTLQPYQDAVIQSKSETIGRLVLPLLGVTYLRLGDLVHAELTLQRAIELQEWALRQQSAAQQTETSENAARAYRGMIELRLRQNRVDQALQTWLQYRSAMFGETAPITPPAPALGRTLYFVELENGDWKAFVRDNSGVRVFALPVKDEELTRTVRMYLSFASDPSADAAECDRLASQLYDWIIRPVESEIQDTDTLVVSTDSILQELPFTGLRDSRGAYLGDRFAIVRTTTGAPQLTRALALTTTGAALAVGSPALGEDDEQRYPALPNAETEARSVAAHFEDATLLTGQQATHDAVVRDLERAELFHFAGHARSGVGTGALLLAPNSDSAVKTASLDAPDIQRLDLHKLKLVVLSACTTDQRRVEGRNDAGNLPVALLRAGAQNVVASRWEVDSDATQIMMARFYEALFNGEDPARALRQARMRVRGNPLYARPYYWSAFELIAR
jgi:CHAT domain-containing protein